MTTEDIVRELVKTADVFAVVLSESRITAYLEALADHEAADVVDALQVIRKRAKFFPRPAEIREAIGGSPEDLAEEAWECVRTWERGGKYNEIFIGSPLEHNGPGRSATYHAVDCVGGWRLLTGDAEIRQIPYLHREFVAAFLRYYRKASLEHMKARALGPAPSQKALPARP